jgi:demethylmenaquinone methyltransferase / 2-methoxy-6-polyprenyl-1,4-benzoquinol methylase
MFDAISARYDLLNKLLSAGFDRRWRERAIDSLKLTGAETLLDVCTGTADVPVGALRRKSGAARRCIGVDFASAMLGRGRAKVRRARLDGSVRFIRADASSLPLASGSVDAVTMTFGIRNICEPGEALCEMHRVLRDGGRLAILEFGLPRIGWIRAVYLWYFRRVLPLVGRAVSRHETAYTYLPESVCRFLEADELSAVVRRAGFSEVSCVHLTLGVVYLCSGVRTGTRTGDTGRLL